MRRYLDILSSTIYLADLPRFPSFIFMNAESYLRRSRLYVARDLRHKRFRGRMFYEERDENQFVEQPLDFNSQRALNRSRDVRLAHHTTLAAFMFVPRLLVLPANYRDNQNSKKAEERPLRIWTWSAERVAVAFMMWRYWCG